MSIIEEYVEKLEKEFPKALVNITWTIESTSNYNGSRSRLVLWTLYVGDEVCNNMEFHNHETMFSWIDSELLGAKQTTIEEAEQILKEIL